MVEKQRVPDVAAMQQIIGVEGDFEIKVARLDTLAKLGKFNPATLDALTEALWDGDIYGARYNWLRGPACINGTAAKSIGLVLHDRERASCEPPEADCEAFRQAFGFDLDCDSYMETMFNVILPGDMPDNSGYAALLLSWIDEARAKASCS